MKATTTNKKKRERLAFAFALLIISLVNATSINEGPYYNFYAGSSLPPDTTLSATPTSGASPLTVVFTALCTDSDGTISSCVINFGDGRSAVLSRIESPQTISYTYTKSGVFTATLNAVDNSGTSDNTPALVTITTNAPNDDPETTLSATPISGTAPLTVIFTALCQDPNAKISSCVINFGDGESRILSNIQLPQKVTHTYFDEGSFLATLTAVDEKGSEDQTPASITITTTTENIDPQTELSVIPFSGTSPFEVTFIARCSDIDGTISSCEIDFGDGNGATLQSIESPQAVAHQYINTESNRVFRAATVRATDNRGASDQTPVVKIITVLPGLDRTPQTFLQAFPTRGKTPLEVTFSALCFDADGEISSCEIEFGDGEEEELLNSERVQQVTHVYTNPRVDDQRFIAKLKASDDDGQTDPTPDQVTIIVENDVGNAPTTTLSATPISGNVPLEVTFTARCDDLQNRLSECKLDFGDNTSQSLPLVEISQTVKHIYRSRGNFIATLSAKDQEGLIDLSPASININLATTDGGAVSERTAEFDIDIKNALEEQNITGRKRVFNGFLFGNVELRLDVPQSRVKRIVLEVKDTSQANDLYITLAGGEIYRDQPDPGVYVINVNEDLEGPLVVKASSPGFFRFWTANFYEVRVTVVTEQFIEQQNDFSFVLPTLSGLTRGRVEQWPAGTIIMLNGVQLDNAEISKNLLEEMNSVVFVAQPGTRVRDKVVMRFFYSR